MEDNFSIIVGLLRDERSAIEASEKYMLRGFDANRKWSNQKKAADAEKQKPKRTKSSNEFWNSCMHEFRAYAEKIKPLYTQQIEYNIDSQKLSDGTFERENFNIEKISTIKNIRWISDIDLFEESYNKLEEFYLSHTKSRKDCRNLFNELLQSLKAAEKNRISEVEECTQLLGKIKLEYLEEIFNLKNIKICKLLPYLLTALCFNYERDKISSDFLTKVFQESADCYQAINIKRQIECFVQSLSLRGHSKEIAYPASARPSAYFDLSVSPYIMNAGVLRSVFNQWCRIIPRYAHTARLYRLEKELDLQGCQLLFDYYVQNPEAAKESIPSS